MRHAALLGAAMVVLAGRAQAQSALMVVSHNDPDGLVEPGQTINVKAVLSWTGATQLAGVRGDLRATPEVGSGAGITSDFFSGALVNLGHVAGGSVVGVDIAVTPMFFTGGFLVPPSGNSSGIKIVAFDWTAPASGFSGLVRFDFITPPSMPEPVFYPSTSSPAFTPLPTVWIGGSIVVTPAPGTAGACLLVGFTKRRRR